MTLNIAFSELVELGHSNKDSIPRRQLFAGTGSKPAIVFPPIITAYWEEQVDINIENVLLSSVETILVEDKLLTIYHVAD